jgi:polysaccharide export outer membrane protein
MFTHEPSAHPNFDLQAFRSRLVPTTVGYEARKHRFLTTRYMKALAALLLLIGVSSSRPCFAQQPGARPVITPAPESAPAAAPTAPEGARVAPADAPPVNVDPYYIIGPEDSILVNVWKEPSFTESVLVRPDGMISMPAVGDIPAAGRTPMQLATEITSQLKKYIIDPTVTITVLAVNSKHIYLVGEVGRIGPMAMTPNMTVLQAISSAGGVSAYANKKHIYIIRGEPGKQTKIPFNYTKAVKTGDSQGITLEPGDTIVVP